MDIKDKYTIIINSSVYNVAAIERIKEFFYQLTKTNKVLFCPEFYFFPGLRIPFDIRIFDEIVSRVKLQNQTSAFQIYCHDNINFGVRLSEKQGTYKASLNLFIPASYLQPERKEIKPIDLLELFSRMLASLEKPYGSVAPQSNREQFRKIRRVIDTEKVPEAIYWLHYFEQAQVNVIGRERLKKTPCHKILETPALHEVSAESFTSFEDAKTKSCKKQRTTSSYRVAFCRLREQGGILLIMLEDFFDQNCEEHRMLQTEIHQRLRLADLHRQYAKKRIDADG